MAEQCFRKKGSNPPVCGVHNVLLLPTHSSDPNPNVKFFVCPVSGQTIRDVATQP